MPAVALFVPCFVDQFRPAAAIAAVTVLERLGWSVHVAHGATCCGQPPTNAGLHEAGAALTQRFVDAHTRSLPANVPVVVLSGSCAWHVISHAASADLPSRVYEFTAFLHDVVGVESLAAHTPRCEARVALHIGCHGLRGLGLATPSERALPMQNKLAAVLAAVPGLEIATLARPDECCGFGGTFAVGEPDISVRMAHDRLREMRTARAQAVVTTDLSCTLHLESVASADPRLPMWHVAEVLAGTAHP
jgi:L-lactate dehydrogenase complex protein LldE